MSKRSLPTLLGVLLLACLALATPWGRAGEERTAEERAVAKFLIERLGKKFSRIVQFGPNDLEAKVRALARDAFLKDLPRDAFSPGALNEERADLGLTYDQARKLIVALGEGRLPLVRARYEFVAVDEDGVPFRVERDALFAVKGGKVALYGKNWHLNSWQDRERQRVQERRDYEATKGRLLKP
jgi:hypothetical protein